MRLSGAVVRAVTLCIAVTLALSFAAACGDPKPVTVADRFTEILGHEPTGVAADVAKNGKIIIVNDADYAPQSSVDPKTGESTGFDVDVARKVCEILGLEPQFKQTLPEGVPAGLKKGHYDVAIDSMMVTADGARAATFTEPYYFTPGQVIIKKGGVQVESIDDLDGLTVGVLADTVLADFLRKHEGITSVTYLDEADLAAALSDGTLNAALVSATGAQTIIETTKHIEVSGKPVFYQPLAFATRRGEGDMVTLLNDTIAKMHADGSLSELSQRWFGGLDLSVRE